MKSLRITLCFSNLSSKLGPLKGNPKVLCFYLLLLGLLLRLPILDLPREVIFDEFHFGKFTTHYCCDHKHFFDIHPPHAKLFIAAQARLASYQGDQPFAAIGEKILPSTPIFAMRFAPALWGALIAPLFFLLLQALGLSIATALVGAACLLLDNGIWVQSRFMLLDATLLCGLIGSLLFYQYSYLAPQRRTSLFMIAISGMFAGLAVGTKFTGLTAVGVVGLFLCWDSVSSFRQRSFKSSLYKMLIFIALFIVVYLIGWYIHFQWLPYNGPGDAFYRPTGHFFQDLIAMHKSMLSANYGITTAHHDASKWWSWPLMITPVYYWVSGSKVLYFLGNPVVWWGTLLIFLLSLATLFLKWKKIITIKAHHFIPTRSFLFIGIAFFFSFVPYIIIPRPLFLYHYLPPLVFLVAWSMLCLEKVGLFHQENQAPNYKNHFLAGLAIAAGFIALLPITSGFSETLSSFKDYIFMVFPGWR